MNNVFEKEFFLCTNCNGSNYTKVISAVGAELKYCNDCNAGKEIAEKELKKDSILKEIITYLNNNEIKDGIKIEITIQEEMLSLNIDDVLISKEHFPFKLKDIEATILESLVLDAVTDIVGEECAENAIVLIHK